jgi:hypothetical protein
MSRLRLGLGGFFGDNLFIVNRLSNSAAAGLQTSDLHLANTVHARFDDDER